MKIEVKRFEFGTNYTIGKMSIDGQYLCFTLEDKVREVQGEPVESWKAKGQTAIPTGTYSVTINFSERFDRNMPLVLNVPGFDGIRIHPGNTDQDTEGCILLGTSWAGTDFIGNSRIAFNQFFPKLALAISNNETVTMEIS